MNGVLRRIVERKREHVASCKARVSHRALRERAESPNRPAVRPFGAAIRGAGTRPRVIAEFKRRSPSRGEIRPGADPVEIARIYERAGAAAMSVLTDVDFFGGSDADLTRVRGACDIPLLRKDFTLDAYQVYEAAVIGADAVLLIVRILEDSLLRELLATTGAVGLDALVEVHDRAELDRAVAAGATIIGINSRDLDTFTVSLDTCMLLWPHIPPGVIAVAESGIHAPADVQRLAAAKFDAMLIGESLMAADNPAARLQEFLTVTTEAPR